MKADKKKITRLLNTAKGQLNGISKMIEEDRYCIDISTQIMATQAILSKVNHEILRAHMNHCVKEAFEEAREESKVQLQEDAENSEKAQADHRRRLAWQISLP